VSVNLVLIKADVFLSIYPILYKYSKFYYVLTINEQQSQPLITAFAIEYVSLL